MSKFVWLTKIFDGSVSICVDWIEREFRLTSCLKASSCRFVIPVPANPKFVKWLKPSAGISLPIFDTKIDVNNSGRPFQSIPVHSSPLISKSINWEKNVRSNDVNRFHPLKAKYLRKIYIYKNSSDKQVYQFYIWLIRWKNSGLN